MASTLSSFLKSVLGITNNPYGMFNMGKSLIQLLSGTGLKDTSAGKDASNVVSGVDNYFGSLFGSLLGTNLTGSEREQNEWTAMREDTYFQRNTQGMIDAGLNPALMYGSGASGPSVNSSAGGPASGLSDLLQLAMIPTQIELAKSQAQDYQASAANKAADTEKKRAEIPWIDKLNAAEVRSKNAGAGLDEAKVGEVEQNIKTGKAQTTKLYQEAKSEEKKRELMDTQMLLNNANAQRIEALLPFEQLLMEANTDAQKAEAGYKLVQTAYQQKLVDSDYIESIIKSAGANATVAEVEAYLSSGDYNGGVDEGPLKEFMHRTISGINNAIRVVSPVKSVSSVTIGKQ